MLTQGETTGRGKRLSSRVLVSFFLHERSEDEKGGPVGGGTMKWVGEGERVCGERCKRGKDVGERRVVHTEKEKNERKCRFGHENRDVPRGRGKGERLERGGRRAENPR